MYHKRRADQCIYQSAPPTKTEYVTIENCANKNSKSIDALPVYLPVFACELNMSDNTTTGIDNNLSIITPTCLKISRIWFIGTLTSYTPSKKGGIIRISDPTGVLTLHASHSAPDMNITASDLIPPLFLSITAIGEKSSEQDEKPYKWVVQTSKIATREERDKWILTAADSLLLRLKEMNTSILTGKGSDLFMATGFHYNIQQSHLKLLAEQAKQALNVIKEPGPQIEPSKLILSIIREYSGPKGLNMDDIYRYTRRSSLTDELVRDTIRSLIAEDEVYQPSPGYIKLL